MNNQGARLNLKNYNPKENWNFMTKHAPVPSEKEVEEFAHTAELLQEAMKQKVKVFVMDPFKPGSLFEVKKFDKSKHLFYLHQPEAVAKTFDRRSFEIVMTRRMYLDEISKQNQTMLFFTDHMDFLNAKPVTVIEEKVKEVVKKEQIIVEKNASDSIRQKDLIKEIKKLDHTMKKQLSSNFHFVVDTVLEGLSKQLNIDYEI
jgi:hypothetical protein